MVLIVVCVCGCVCVCVCVCVWWGQWRGGRLGEGQGCVYNVNTVKATDTKGRGKERGGPHPVPYILFQIIVLCSCCSPKTRGRTAQTVRRIQISAVQIIQKSLSLQKLPFKQYTLISNVLVGLAMCGVFFLYKITAFTNTFYTVFTLFPSHLLPHLFVLF